MTLQREASLRRALLIGLIPLVTAACLTRAHAAEEPPRASEQGGATRVDEVIVTATRREASLRDAPVAITAIPESSRVAKSIYRPWDLAAQVPGFDVTAESGRGTRPSYAIRGMGTEFGAAAGSVETYFADVPLSGPFQEPAMVAPFFDLQSVQVLKGPQGALFGRSTTAGAVLFVPRAPSDIFGGYGRIQIGSYGDVQAEGALNAPIVPDKVLLRVAGFRWTRDGYGRTTSGRLDFAGRPLPVQTYDNQDVLELRATLVLKPTEALENSTILTFHRDNNRNTGHASVIDPSTTLGGLIATLYPGITALPVHVSDISTDLWKIHSENWGLFNTTTYAPTPALTVKNIFAFIHAQGVGDVSSDVDGTPLPAIDLPPIARANKHDQITDEVQLLGESFDRRLSWIVGGIADLTRQPGGANEGPIINVLNALPGVNTYFQQNTFNNFALYGSAAYHLTSRLTATAGYRHSWDDIHVVQDNASVTTAQYLANPDMIISAYPPGVVAHLDHRQRFEGDAYDLGLQYQLSSPVMTYGGYRRGFKQGGFNVSSPPNAPDEQAFAPEWVDDFHLGLKSQFALGKIKGRFNLEGFWDLYYNKQVSYLTLTGAGANAALSTVTINVPQTTYRGLDADLSLEPTQWIQLDVLYTYVDARYGSWPDRTFAATAGAPACPPGGCANLHLDLSRNPVAFAPPNKVAVTARFHTELPHRIGEFVVQPNLTYQDKLYTIGDAFMLPQGESAWLGLPFNYSSAAHGGDVVSAYMLANLRVELNHVLGSNIDAALNLTNLSNKRYSLGDTTALAFGVQSDSYGPPWMITVELSTHF